MWRAPPVTMATRPPNLTTTSRSDGVLEYWSIGFRTHHSTTPALHYSKSSSFEPLEMFAEVHWPPPGFHAQRFRDHLRGVVARRAGDIAARMTRRAAHEQAVDRRAVLTPAGKRPVLQRLIAGIFADHPVTAVHIFIVALDIERRGRIGRENIALVQIRRKFLPDSELLIKPLVARLVPIKRIAPKIISHQLPHERGRFARRRLGRVVKRRRRAIHEWLARQLPRAAILEEI